MTENFNPYLKEELAYNLNKSNISQIDKINSVAKFCPILNDPLINLFNKNKQKIKFLEKNYFEKNKIVEYLGKTLMIRGIL
jgi:hypothetical protein